MYSPLKYWFIMGLSTEISLFISYQFLYKFRVYLINENLREHDIMRICSVHWTKHALLSFKLEP